MRGSPGTLKSHRRRRRGEAVAAITPPLSRQRQCTAARVNPRANAGADLRRKQTRRESFPARRQQGKSPKTRGVARAAPQQSESCEGGGLSLGRRAARLSVEPSARGALKRTPQWIPAFAGMTVAEVAFASAGRSVSRCVAMFAKRYVPARPAFPRAGPLRVRPAPARPPAAALQRVSAWAASMHPTANTTGLRRTARPVPGWRPSNPRPARPPCTRSARARRCRGRGRRRSSAGPGSG